VPPGRPGLAAEQGARVSGVVVSGPGPQERYRFLGRGAGLGVMAKSPLLVGQGAQREGQIGNPARIRFGQLALERYRRLKLGNGGR
jgi:hypothetical protein